MFSNKHLFIFCFHVQLGLRMCTSWQKDRISLGSLKQPWRPWGSGSHWPVCTFMYRSWRPQNMAIWGSATWGPGPFTSVKARACRAQEGRTEREQFNARAEVDNSKSEALAGCPTLDEESQPKCRTEGAKDRNGEMGTWKRLMHGGNRLHTEDNGKPESRKMLHSSTCRTITTNQKLMFLVVRTFEVIRSRWQEGKNMQRDEKFF